MRAGLLLVMLLLVSATVSMTAFAKPYNPNTEILAKINRIHPLQNPQYERASALPGRRILDRKSKVVGTLHDIVLNRNGNIAFLAVTFDRMQLNRPVFISYSTYDIRPTSNGYAMAFDVAEIETVYPVLLADIQSAAGENDETISLRTLSGAEIWSAGGRKIGHVSDVLFNADGQKAEALYIEMTAASLSGRGVAVPFTAANLEKFATERRITVTDQTAEAMIAQVKG